MWGCSVYGFRRKGALSLDKRWAEQQAACSRTVNSCTMVSLVRWEPGMKIGYTIDDLSAGYDISEKTIFGYPNRMCLPMPKLRTLQHQFLVSILAQVFSDFHIRWLGASTAFPTISCQFSALSYQSCRSRRFCGSDVGVQIYKSQDIGRTHLIHQEEEEEVNYKYEVRIEGSKSPNQTICNLSHLGHAIGVYLELSNLTLQRHRSSVESSLPFGVGHGPDSLELFYLNCS